jgi:Hydroxymethylglutaryl-coenzyme A reductase
LVAVGSGKKFALAETVVAFALALEVSSFGAIANDAFAKSHIDLQELRSLGCEYANAEVAG